MKRKILFFSALITIIYCAPSISENKKSSQKTITKDVNSEDLPISGMFLEVEGLVEPIRGLIHPFIQKGKIHFLSLTEDLLEKSTELVDNIGDLVTKLNNNTKFRTETKQKLRYLKTKARHLREDIEDNIEIEKEKAKKAQSGEDKKRAEESVHLLTAARDRLKDAITKHFKKREKRGQNIMINSDKQDIKNHRFWDKSNDVKLSSEKNKDKNKNETSTESPFNKFGLGDGFGEHTY